MSTANFIISLDFELHWGVFDHTDLDARGRSYFDTTRELIPPTLELFAQYGTRATWATVGLLFANNRRQVEEAVPEVLPRYHNERLNPYALLRSIGQDEASDPYHYAPSLIRQILATDGQEVGSHTFSHFYCLEAGVTAEAFASDLQASRWLARENFGIELQSLVFPRNQCAYPEVIRRQGFGCYRSNPDVWFWKATNANDTSLHQKAVRLADHYLPLSRSDIPASRETSIGLPASRFFRPYQSHIDGYGGQYLKVRRILGEMTRAARHGNSYHLWWHPHNLATNPRKNLAALDHILQHYRKLNRRYGMQSMNMKDLISLG